MNAANVPSWLIISAFRYALGRKSYVVSECCDWLVQNWGTISEGVRGIIRRDLEREFESDDRARKMVRADEAFLPLGMDMDRKEWERVRKLWTPEGEVK